MNTKIFFTIIIFFASFIFSSCEDDDPLQPEEEHFVPIGTAIYDATGALYVTIFRGVTSDTLFIQFGELSDHFDVKFFDENEEIVEAPENENTKLNYSIDDETIIEFWQHEDDQGGFEFHLRGLKKGVTSIELLIEHEGHNDYRSGKIPVKVR